MSWTNMVKPKKGEPTKLQSFAALVIDNLAFLYNLVLSIVGSREAITNGSFESDANGDGDPDGWVITKFNGGAFSYELSTATADGKAVHGKRSIKFTSPGGGGNGGGQVVSQDYFEITEGRTYQLTWQHKSSVAGIHNVVSIQFFDSTLTSISTTTLYDSTTNPTAWTIGYGGFTPPANARYAKVTLVGAKNDNTTAGSAWFDDVRIATPDGMKIVVFDANTTWVVPAGIYRVRVRCWGGGGAGQSASGLSGGGGGYGEDVFAVVPGTSYAVTVGNGGTVSGGNGGTSSLIAGSTLISATGGQGGSGVQGVGGTSSATINVTGSTGGPSLGGCPGGGGGGGGLGAGNPGIRPGGGGAGGALGCSGGGGRIIIEYLT